MTYTHKCASHMFWWSLYCSHCMINGRKVRYTPRNIHTPFLFDSSWSILPNVLRMTSMVSRKFYHGPLVRFVKLWVVHAPGMPGTFYPSSRVSDPDMHHGTCVMHVPWCMPGSLTSGLLGSRWRGKRSRHSRRMRKPQFYVSGKKPLAECQSSNTNEYW